MRELEEKCGELEGRALRLEGELEDERRSSRNLMSENQAAGAGPMSFLCCGCDCGEYCFVDYGSRLNGF